MSTPDPLTIAYLAMGASDAICECGGTLPTAICDEYEGQLGFIGHVINQAEMLDEMAEKLDWNDGVFVYDVAEPFGYQYALAILKGEEPDARLLATKILEEASRG